jgi:hypothetical protein
MSNFRTRILGLAAVATAFVGVSFGQNVTCTSNQAGIADGATTNATGATTNVTQINTALRVEGQTEQLSLLQFGCTGSSSVGGSLTTGGTITFTTNLPITSKATSSTTNEATLIVGGLVGSGGVVTGGFAITGTVSGNTVTFTVPTTGAGSISTPLSTANAPASATTYFELANIRVNASTAPATPYQSTEGGLLAYVTSTTSGTTTAFTAIASTNNSGLVVPSLGPPKITVTNSYTTCTGNTGATTNQSFVLSITQLISGAFLGTGAPPVGELGQYALSEGTPTVSADTINVTLSSLPSGSTVYVPKSVQAIDPSNAGNFTTLAITGAATAGGTNIPTGYTSYAVPSTGTVAIPYTVSAVSGNGAPANIPYQVAVIVGFAANSVTTLTTVTGNYSYAPTAATLTGPAAAIPTFVASNFTPASGSTISLCQTTLLFPFVTNQVGFDTGIAIANTSQDNLGSKGASVATPQAGICQLYFYGPFAPAPATGTISVIPDPMGSLAGGNTHAFQLSSLAPGYQGYVIAVCPFNYAHAYAFITNANAKSTGVAEGYLAEVLGGNDRGQSVATGDFGITF